MPRAFTALTLLCTFAHALIPFPTMATLRKQTQASAGSSDKINVRSRCYGSRTFLFFPGESRRKGHVRSAILIALPLAVARAELSI